MKTETQKIRYTSYHEDIKCDLCHASYTEDANDENDKNHIAEAQFPFLTSYNPYDGSRFDNYEFEICHKCFKDKLLPLLATINLIPRFEETI
jgi:hypothetical protein